VLEIDCADPERALTKLNEAIAAGEPGFVEAALHGAAVHAVTSEPAAAEHAVRRVLHEAGIAVSSVALAEPTLEDVFVSLVRRQRQHAAVL
jgi:ABC-2 type transport system ATP-binding protein